MQKATSLQLDTRVPLHRQSLFIKETSHLGEGTTFEDLNADPCSENSRGIFFPGSFILFFDPHHLTYGTPHSLFLTHLVAPIRLILRP